VGGGQVVLPKIDTNRELGGIKRGGGSGGAFLSSRTHKEVC